MTPEESLKIQSQISDKTLRNSFIIFYQKALDDGDVIARIEDKLRDIDFRLNSDSGLDESLRVLVTAIKEMFNDILYGEDTAKKKV